MTRDVNFCMSGQYIMTIPNEQPAGKVSFHNLNLANKKLRANEKIVNFSVLYKAVS